MNALNLIRLVIALVIVAVLVDLVWDKVTVIPISVHMPWYGFVITLVVVFLIMDVIVMRVLQRMRG
jgi:cytochrome c biogenesis factor